MRKLVRTVILSVCFFSLFITCKNYSESIDDYLSYWSTAAAIETYTFNPEPHIDAKGTQWVSSTASTTVTFTVRNPKNFELKNPADSSAPADSITFPYDPAISGATAPQANRDYTFKKISNTEFELTYTPTFLQQYEWGSVDITPTIVLHTADGRMFKQTIPFTLKVNTPPPAIAKCVIAQTKTTSSAETSYYVLCLQLPAAEMNRELNGSLVHKDIAGITINETSYSLSVDSAQKQFNVKAGSPFIGKDSVEKLAADAEEVPFGWTLYFKTNVAVGDAKKSYTISIKDEKGLYSKPVTAATQLSEPQQAQIDVIKGTLIPSLSGDGTEQSKAIVIKADAATPKAQIKLSVPATGGVSATGVTIHYRLTEVGRPSAPEQTEAASPITVDMPLNGAGEKIYELIYYTAGVGFKPSASKTVYYKVLKEHTVTFSVDGRNGTLSARPQGGSENSTGTITVEHGKSVTFTATPTEGWEVDSWTGVTPDTSSPDKTKATLSSVTNTTTVTVKFKKKQAVPISDWEALRTAVKNASDGDVIEIEQNLTYNKSHAAGKDSIIEVNNNITIKSKGSDTCTLDAGGKGADSEQSNDKSTGVFEVSGGKTLTLENLILTKTEKYAVYVAEGDNSLTMKKVTITNCKTHYNAAGIYFNKGKNLTLTDCTIENCKGKGINSSGGIDIQAPKETVSIKNTKIKNCEVTGTQSTGGGIHLYNANNVQCKVESVTVDNCSALRGGGIYVKGGTLTITGGSFINNSAGGTITSGGGGAIYSEGAKVTITGCTIGDDDSNKGNYAGQGGGIFVNGGAECILEAGTKIIGNSAIDLGTGTGNGGGVYVAGNSSLKMENVTIKNCEASGTDSAGGGVYLYKGTCTLEKVIVEECKAPKGGGIFVSEEAECILKQDVKILQNEAMGTNSNGGGIFVDKVQSGPQTGTLTIKGSKEKPVVIAKNTADNHGGGLYSFGTVNIEYAEIKENRVPHDGGGMYNAGICTMDNVTIQNNRAFTEDTNAGRGGGIYSDETLTLTNTTVTDNEAKTGGGIYIAEHSKAFNMSGSTVITVDPSKNDVFLRTGRLITIVGSLTAIGNVARITLEKYTVGAKVLQASSTECAKFTVTPSAGTWSINTDGTLKKP